jgi:hypothetical protein
MSKRKHCTLSINEKLNILKELDSGKCVTELAKTYGIGKATVCDIKLKRQHLLSYAASTESGPSTKRSTLKTSRYPQVEKALYTWFLQERSRHTP